MNEALEAKASELLVKMIDVTVQSVSDVVEFGKQQIPEVIHQLIMWNIAKVSIWMIVGVVIAVFLCQMGNRFKPNLNQYEKGLGTFVQFIFWVVGLAVGGSMFVSNLLQVAYIVIAPKVWLIEYAAQLIKK
jgi:hypothetical protein